MKELAIVIPAYKADFLDETLSSLALQTSKEFTVYIGNDASPYDLDSIVEKYRKDFPLKYHTFHDNLGGKDLVAQWERCVQLCGTEEWICIFSDDDIMQTGVIESFHNMVIPDNCDIVHFNIEIINEQGDVIRRCPEFPTILDDASFFDLLFRRKIDARMPEFIFRRSFLAGGRSLVNFDLAWRSDTATVLAAARKGGIITISGLNSKVLWRASFENISGRGELKRKKNKSNIAFFNWLSEWGVPIKMSRFYLLKTIVFSLEYDGPFHFFRDGLCAIRKMRYAKGYRGITILFLLYRIPYHWMEIHRNNSL